jgi:hypothetical protein
MDNHTRRIENTVLEGKCRVSKFGGKVAGAGTVRQSFGGKASCLKEGEKVVGVGTLCQSFGGKTLCLKGG